MEEDLSDYYRRLFNAELVAQNKSRSELARYLQVNPSQISRLLGVEEKNKGKSPPIKLAQLTLDKVEQISRFLDIKMSPEILIARGKSYVKFAPFRGELAHGVWLEKIMVRQKHVRQIPYLPVAEFAHLEQYAYTIIDNHAKSFAEQDSFVICVDYNKARSSPKDEDVVVIERVNTLAGGKSNVVAVERTLRIVSLQDGKVALIPLTDDPDVQEISYDPKGTGITIKALVLGTFNLSTNISL
jgi:tricorn protease-like protein